MGKNVLLSLRLKYLSSRVAGIDEDDGAAGDVGAEAAEEMPPLEGDDEDASRMEEVD